MIAAETERDIARTKKNISVQFYCNPHFFEFAGTNQITNVNNTQTKQKNLLKLLINVKSLAE